MKEVTANSRMRAPRTTRRGFLAASAAAALQACTPPPGIAGTIVGPDRELGHRLREGSLPPPSARERTGVVIVGGGIAGLSAARALARAGRRDFVLLEPETETGGNSRSGVGAVSAYPWGAHYLPLPGPHAPEVEALLGDFGVVTGRDAAGRPLYREEFLCHDPSERLFVHGRWQEGLVPQLGVTAAGRAEIAAFFARMDDFRDAVGADGRPAFAIPVDRSSRDPAMTALDSATMRDWMDREGYVSPPLRWYVDYCCRDDFGAGIGRVSAWAGIHYFAARGGVAGNAAPGAVLTWPEGNGWLAARLRADIPSDLVRTRHGVFRLEQDGRHAELDVFDAGAGRTLRLECDAVIFAAPRFVHERLRPRADLRTGLPVYSPWVVANLSLDAVPSGRGAAPAWDNVVMGARSLGYVLATHQHLAMRPSGTVLTWYRPLDDGDPSGERRAAAGRTWMDWRDMALEDLSVPHPGIRHGTSRLDVMVWGHGMVTPEPGFIHGPERARMLRSEGVVRFAHSDMSGVSIFEEAYLRGVEAAGDVLRSMGHRPGPVQAAS